MKITSIDLIAIESILGESFCPVFTRIHTNEGISGIGQDLSDFAMSHATVYTIS